MANAAHYVATVDLYYRPLGDPDKPEKHAQPGDKVDDLPPSSFEPELAADHIEQVKP